MKCVHKLSWYQDSSEEQSCQSNNRNGCEKNGQCLSCYVSEFEGSGNTTYINLMPFCGIAVSFRCSFNLSQRMDNEGNLIFLF